VILRVVALKYAARRLFDLQRRQDFTGVASAADGVLSLIEDLTPHLVPHETLIRFFAEAKAHPDALSLPEVLRAVLTLPY
jgi:hypothetical protein